MSLGRRTRSLDDEGKRKIIHPIEVKGPWKRRRNLVQFGLIFFLLAIPWIKVRGQPLLLLNILERKFSVFGILFRAHDVPLIFLFFASFALLFAILTTLFGRVWCGWACPQTVFIESVFRRIESWFEGNAFERKKQQLEPMTFDRVLMKALKWFTFFLVTLVITHSVLAIFVGPEAVQSMIMAGPSESPIAFLFVAISTAVILFDFGWFREQFCIVVCPYGRIQSVFQDEKTRTVAYQAKRGEPRGKVGEGKGDCVDCMRCVQVCPTGIDIRDGSSQLECIACTACMDACDDVMTRLKRERGLIKYASIDGVDDRGKTILKGRASVYMVLLCLVAISIVWIAETRTRVMVEVFKNRGAPFVLVTDTDKNPDHEVANLFVAEISNHTNEKLTVHFELEPPDQSGIELVMPNNTLTLGPGDYLRQPFTVRFARRILAEGSASAQMRIESTGMDRNQEIHETLEKELRLVGPYSFQ